MTTEGNPASNSIDGLRYSLAHRGAKEDVNSAARIPSGAAISNAINVTFNEPTTNGMSPNFGCSETGCQVVEISPSKVTASSPPLRSAFSCLAVESFFSSPKNSWP